MKKVTGEAAENHYKRVLGSTGEIVDVMPEFTRMSLKPGIGRTWIEKFYTDVYPRDEDMVNGMKCKPPRYYEGVFDWFRSVDDVEVNRFERALGTKEDSTPERLAVREKVTEARLRFKKRDLE